MSLTLHQGDCLEVLRTLPDESVQCCVTSPPYWGLRDYGCAGQIGLEETLDEFLGRLIAVFDEVRRVLRKDGTCWVNMGDSYARDPGKGGSGPGGKNGEYGDTYTNAAKKRSSQGKNGLMAGRSVTEALDVGSRGVCGLKPKDLVGQPWRLAFALQASGWWLRQDIIWHKPNPMPESVTDRCTKAHEYLFLLTKAERYFWNAEAMREPFSYPEMQKEARRRKNGNSLPVGNYARGSGRNDGGGYTGGMGYASKHEGRNRRSVWTIATEPYSEAHFATFPTELPRRCILASTRPGDVVLDPFGGSGTTGKVAIELGRKAVLIELNPEYAAMIQRRTNVTPGLPIL